MCGAPPIAMTYPSSVASSPTPSVADDEDDFWGIVDEVFGELGEDDGEEVGNLFWIERPETTKDKLVLQVGVPARGAVRSLHALLGEQDTPFAGAKLLVNRDVLAILYLQPDAILHYALLADVVSCCGAIPFRPYNSTTPEAHLVWVGRSSEVDSMCEPVY